MPADEQYLSWAQRYCATATSIPIRRGSLLSRAANFAWSYTYGRHLRYRKIIEEKLWSGLRSRNWDVLHVEGGFAGGLVPPELPIPKILSAHDSEVLRAIEMLNCQLDLSARLRCSVRRFYEPRYDRLVYPRYDRCVLVAERDLAFNQRLVPHAQFLTIPYGVDTDYYHPMQMAKNKGTIVFHGNLSYAPNVQAALDLANDVLPKIRSQIPKVLLHLVGANPHAAVQALGSRPNVLLSANLPDLRSALCTAEVYVSGVRFGTGLKNKVLEAMALGLPIVCYPGSVSGIDCVPGKHLLVANDPQEFAAHLETLMRRPEMAQQLAKAARELVIEKYSWESKAAQWSTLYQQVVDLRNICLGPARENVGATAVLYN